MTYMYGHGISRIIHGHMGGIDGRTYLYLPSRRSGSLLLLLLLLLYIDRYRVCQTDQQKDRDARPFALWSAQPGALSK